MTKAGKFVLFIALVTILLLWGMMKQEAGGRKSNHERTNMYKNEGGER